MCILILSSSNPNFSFIIKKNPESGMIVKNIRKGHAFGYYKKNSVSEYVIYFKDSDNEISYKEYTDQEFEYTSNLKYTSSIFVLNAINEFFNKISSPKDLEGFSHSLCVNLVNIQSQTLNIINRIATFFSDYKISYENKVGNNYQISINTNKSLCDLLNFAIMYFGIISAENENNDLNFDDNFIEKILKIVNILDAPYYVRYIFASRILASSKLFKKFKKILEKPNMKLHTGNTALQRRNYIESLLQFDKPIIDIGCGDGYYAIAFAPKIKHTYYAVDIETECLEKLRIKAKKLDINNIELYNSHRSLDTINSEQKYDVVITEVVEHMSVQESEEIIKFVLDKIKFDKIIITTPNFEFNKFYQLENKFRHDDHKWEYTRIQFKKYIEDIVCDYPIQLKFVGIGDTVDGIPLSQGVIVTHK